MENSNITFTRNITITFSDNGEIKLDTGDCTLAEISFAAKLLNNNVDANLNRNNLEMMLDKNYETLLNFFKAKGLVVQDTNDDETKAERIIVRCNSDSKVLEGLLTSGNEYTAVSMNTVGDVLIEADDKGNKCWFQREFFEDFESWKLPYKKAII